MTKQQPPVPEATIKSDVQLEAHEYLAFYLGEKRYAVDILMVHEICTAQPLTAIPHAPDFVVGMINLRGAIIPIIDLRLRLAYPAKTYGAITAFIILKVNIDGVQKLMGVAVDHTDDVIAVTENNITLLNAKSNQDKTALSCGYISVADTQVSLLDWLQVLDI